MDTVDYLSVGTSVVAIIIAILAIKFATRTSNHQILVSKVEETYEITQYLLYHYSSLLFIYHQLDESHNSEKYSALERSELNDAYHRVLEEFKKNVDTDDLYNKTSRLKVLTQAYLTPELKVKVLAYNDLFEKLIAVTLYQQKILQAMFYKEGFPEEKQLREFVAELEVDLIKIIKLGKKPLRQNEIATYREDQFKRTLGIK